MTRLLLIGPPDAVARAADEARRCGAEVVRDDAPAVDAVVGVGSDEALRRAAAIAAAAGVPHPHGVDGARRGTDVAAARRALDEAGIAQPPWRECATAAEAAAAAEQVGLPAVVRSLGAEFRATAESAEQAGLLAARALAESYRPACVVEHKRPGGCTRVARADIDAALGCEAVAKVVDGEVVSVRALLADCEPEAAVREALGAPRREAAEDPA